MDLEDNGATMTTGPVMRADSGITDFLQHHSALVIDIGDHGLLRVAWAHEIETSVQSSFADSRHLTSVTPYFSAWGLEIILSGGLPGLGMGAIPASQLAQCHASALRIGFARMMNDFDSP
jgi:hypothetical protein